MIAPMKKDAVLPLLVGLLVGFLATYLIVRERDLGPIVVRDGSSAAASPMAGPRVPTAMEAAMIEQLETELESDPDNAGTLTDLANLYFDTDNYPRAIEYYRRVVELRPDDPNLRTDMGTALYYSGRTEEAVAEFERSLAIEPDHPQTLFNMGVILLEQRNDREGALQLWERLIEMNPGYAQADLVREQIERLRSGQ
jgi:tetratricopeptide (TPR) repeat protein